MQRNAILISRSAAAARNAVVANTSAKDDPTDDANSSGILDAKVEQRRFINFWIGIQKSLQLEHHHTAGQNTTTINRFRTLEESTDWTVILPDNTFKVTWDIFICLLILYSVIIIPYQIGFTVVYKDGFLYWDYIVDAFFFLDILISFNTAYQDDNSETLVLDRKSIARHYLKFWFWIDIVSTLPFDDIFSYFMPSGNLRSIRLVRILRLFRLFKLSSLFKLDEQLAEFRISPSLVSIFTLIIQIFFVAHVFACFWHFIAMPDANPKEPPRTWITEYGFDEKANYDRYIVSLYYIIVTMLTVGYGDIHPTNFNERVYAIVTMLTGGIVFGALISKVARLIDSRNPQAKAFKANMDELKAFMEEIALPNALKIKTKEAYAYYLNKKSSFGESGIFSELPKPVLYKLVFQLYKKDFTAIKLLKTYDAAFVVDLVIHARPFQAMKDEIIFGEGDVCNDIVLISRGSVKITTTDGVRDILCGVVTDGGYFGDFEYYRNTTAIASYTAMKSCDLLCVNHAVFNKVIGESFDAGTNFKAALKKRYNAFIELTKQPVDKEISHVQPAELFTNTTNRRQSTMQNLMTTMHIPVDVSEESRGHTAGHENAHDAKVLSVTHLQRLRSTFVRGNGGLWVDGVLQTPSRSQLVLMNEQNDALGDLPADDHFTFRVTMHIEEHKMILEVGQSFLDKRRLLHPHGPHKMQWDFFIGFWIVYSVLVVPVEIAFHESAYNASDAVNMGVNVCFFLDICVSFRTAYYDVQDDSLVVTPRYIAWHYLSTWFLVDIVSTIPFDTVISAAINGNGSATLQLTKLLKIIRLFRLFKLARLMKMSTYMEKVEEVSGISPAVFDLLTLLVEVFFVAHWIACVWWGLCSIVTKETWMQNPTMVYTDMDLAPLVSQYVISLYFTFSTISTTGYGDIYGINSSERLLNIFIVLVGASIFGYMIANVSGLIDNFNQSAAKKSERLSEITEYLNEKQCPALLQDKVTSHFKNLFHETSAFDVDRILSRLPHTISNDILMVQHKKKMGMIAIFNYIPNESVCLYLFQLMTPIFFERDKFVLKEDRESTEIMFLVSGKASVYQKIVKYSKGNAASGSTKRRRSNTFGRYMSTKLTLDNRTLRKSRRSTKESTFDKKRIPSLVSSVKQGSAGEEVEMELWESSSNPTPVTTPHGVTHVQLRGRTQSNNSTGFQLGVLSYPDKSGSAKSHVYKYDKSVGRQSLSDPLADKQSSTRKVSLSSGDNLVSRDNTDTASVAGDQVVVQGRPRTHSAAEIEARVTREFAEKRKGGEFKSSSEDDASEGFYFVPNQSDNISSESKEQSGKQSAKSVSRKSSMSPADRLRSASISCSGGDYALLPATDTTAAGRSAIPDILSAPQVPSVNGSAEDNDQGNYNPNLGLENGDSSDSEAEEMAVDRFNSHAAARRYSLSRAYRSLSNGVAKVIDTVRGSSQSSSGGTIPPLGRSNSAAPVDKLKPFHLWRDADMAARKLSYVGHIYPGDFVGHLGMMNRTAHQGTVRALETCIVYALGKTEIGKLIRREPTVALLLQNALVEATKAQSAVLGKFRMRKNRAEFMKKELKARFYNLYPKPKRHYLSLPSMTKWWQRYFRGDSHSEQAIQRMTSRESMISLQHSNAPVNREFADHSDLADVVSEKGDPSVVAGVHCGHINVEPTKHYSSTDFTAIYDQLDSHATYLSPSEARRRAKKRIIRKIRRLERILTSKNMNYDSDRDEEAEKSKNVMNHRIKHISRDSSANLPDNTTNQNAFSALSKQQSDLPAQDLKKFKRKSIFAYEASKTADVDGQLRQQQQQQQQQQEQGQSHSSGDMPVGIGINRLNSTISAVSGMSSAAISLFRRRSTDFREVKRPEFKPTVKFASCPDLAALEGRELFSKDVNNLESTPPRSATDSVRLRASGEHPHRRQSFPSVDNEKWRVEQRSRGIV